MFEWMALMVVIEALIIIGHVCLLANDRKRRKEDIHLRKRNAHLEERHRIIKRILDDD